MPGRVRCAILLLAAAACSAPLAWRPAGSALAAYRQSFEDAVGQQIVGDAPLTDIVAMAQDRAVVWLGDHHYSDRLHVLQRDLLTRLQRSGRPLLLLLEAIGEQDEPAVADYVAGRTNEEQLRTRTRRRWPGSWLDDEELDAPHYRALLAFARHHAIPVRALEPTPRLPLAARDAHIAATVRTTAAAHPDRLLVAVLGQAHLLGIGDVVGRSGLPGLVIGGIPPASLRAAAPASSARDRLHRSDGGVWWFGALLAPLP
jgi:hypothetical protein